MWTGDGPQLADGATIPLERTVVPAEISDVLDEASRVAEGIDGKAVASIVHELATALDKDAVAGVTTGLAQVNATVGARATELDDSLVHVQRVVSSLAARDQRIGGLLQSATVVSQALLAQDGALDAAITGLDGLLGEVSRTTGANREKLVATVDVLDRVGRILAAHEAGWQEIITKLPWASYGFYRAIDHDGDRWFLMPQATGVLFAPYVPNMNSRGGPGSDKEDNSVLPRVDFSGSPLRSAVPEQIDLTGFTGEGPLLPASRIGPVTVDGGDE
jgi:ABC-type transporter Mla subunit MlaD